GDVISDFTSPIQNLDIHSFIFTGGYVRTFSLFNKLARIAAVVPYAYMYGSANVRGEDTTATRNGFWDAKIKVCINMLGSPVLTSQEFRKFQEYSVLGVSMVFSLPTGQYIPSKVINIGANRWGFKPEIGYSQRLNRLFYEIYAGIWFFTNNTEYLKTI